MSEVNLNFSVVPVEATLVVTTNDIIFTPTPINMTLYSGSAPIPPAGTGGNTQIQYNNSGVFAGSNSFTFNNTTTTVNITTANVNVLNTNGFNATVANVHITGGTNGYVLQTDGTGNLGWTAMGGGGGGNGVPGGANTQVQFNNAGTFGGVSGFTYDTSTQTLSAPKLYGNGSALYNLSGGSVVGAVYEAFHANAADVANSVAGANVVGIVASATVAANVVNPTQGNITGVGTLTNLGVSGNVTVGNTLTTNQLTANNANLGASVNAGYFIGDGSLLTNLSIAGGSFISNGNSNITFATSGSNAAISINGTSNVVVISTANSAFTSNIATTKNITASGNITGSSITGNGIGITNILAENISGTVANATYAANSTYSLQSNNASYATFIAGGGTGYQPNITRIGTTVFTTQLTNSTQTLSGTVYTYDLTLGQIQTYTGTPTANIQLNVRGNAAATFANTIPNNSSFTGKIILKNGFGNTYTISDIKIDNVSQLVNIRWGNYTGNATSGPQNIVPPAGCTTEYTILITKNSTGTLTTYIDSRNYNITSV